MNSPPLRILGAVLVCVLAAALVWAGCRPGPAGNAGRQQHGPLFEPAENLLPDESGAPQLEVLEWCQETRRALVAELLSGRLTLPETAAGFRAVDEVKRKTVPVVSLAVLAPTEEESLCWRVILFAKGQVRHRPDQEAVLADLEGKLRELARDGALRLPPFRRPAHLRWLEP
jgi:hypothetical protein